MPEIHSLAASLFLARLVPFFASERVFAFPRRSLTITMVRLVVDDDDILQLQKRAVGALKHRAFGLDGDRGLASPLQQSAPYLGHLHDLALPERVIVGDNDLCLGDVCD
jgi:hypothetical protein